MIQFHLIQVLQRKKPDVGLHVQHSCFFQVPRKPCFRDMKGKRTTFKLYTKCLAGAPNLVWQIVKTWYVNCDNYLTTSPLYPLLYYVRSQASHASIIYPFSQSLNKSSSPLPALTDLSTKYTIKMSDQGLLLFCIATSV